MYVAKVREKDRVGEGYEREKPPSISPPVCSNDGRSKAKAKMSGEDEGFKMSNMFLLARSHLALHHWRKSSRLVPAPWGLHLIPQLLRVNHPAVKRKSTRPLQPVCRWWRGGKEWGWGVGGWQGWIAVRGEVALCGISYEQLFVNVVSLVWFCPLRTFLHPRIRGGERWRYATRRKGLR